MVDFDTIDKYVAAVKRGGVAIQMKQFHNLDTRLASLTTALLVGEPLGRWGGSWGSRLYCKGSNSSNENIVIVVVIFPGSLI